MVKENRKKSYMIWGLAIIGYYCWFQSFYNAVRFGDMFPYTDFTDFFIGVIKNFTPIFIICLVNLCIVFRLVKISDMRKKIGADLLLSVVANVLVNGLYAAVYWLLGMIEEFDIGVIDWAGALLNNIIILLCVELVYQFTRMLRLRKEANEAQRQMLLYQFDALKAQVNPHFLFNSLNILHSLVSIDTDKSKKFIHQLAQIYRYIMAQQNKETVSLQQEFGFLDSYLYVLKMRYNNQLEVIINGESDTRKHVVPYTLQLLIENVTKHNIISSHLPMTVTVNLDTDQIVVSNPIHPREADSAGRIGLQYLEKLYAKHGCQFRIQNDGRQFTAYIQLISNKKNDEIRNH